MNPYISLLPRHHHWNLKRYNENPDQLGHIDDYESFLGEFGKRFFGY